MVISGWILLKMRNISDKFVDKVKTHFIFCNIFLESCHLYDNMEKFITAGVATDYNIAHALCMLDN
jgi:hypothetical protein